MVEESFSFGVLGHTGRGALEHWGIAPDQVWGPRGWHLLRVVGVQSPRCLPEGGMVWVC